LQTFTEAASAPLDALTAGDSVRVMGPWHVNDVRTLLPGLQSSLRSTAAVRVRLGGGKPGDSDVDVLVGGER